MVTERQKFLYFLTLLVLVMLIAELSFYLGQDAEPLALLKSTIALFLLTIFGTILCWGANRKGDDQSFVERYVCLYVPVLVKIWGFVGLLSLIFWLLNVDVWNNEYDHFFETSTWTNTGLKAVVWLIVYWRLYVNIRLVAQGEAED